MFVYHNSNMAILVPHRCGHTNIHYYFGLEVYDYSRTFQEWIDHSRKIVVLRNPLERIVSTKSVPEDWKKWVEFTYHTKPFMDILLPYSFEIIPFRELNHYVPFYDKNWQSPVTQSVIYDLYA